MYSDLEAYNFSEANINIEFSLEYASKFKTLRDSSTGALLWVLFFGDIVIAEVIIDTPTWGNWSINFAAVYCLASEDTIANWLR